MFWYLIICSFLLFIIVSYSSNLTTEGFTNNEYVIPSSMNQIIQHATPDIDWRDVEDRLNKAYEGDDEEQKEEEEEVEVEVEVEADEKFVNEKDTPLYSDQIYILQKQKSKPRHHPKFSNDAFNVYEPKTPPLRYETRPGPNSFNDSLTEAGHVETEKERHQDWLAQKNAQWRHQDLLNRLNWVYLKANQYVNPDKILKQPKFIPGPSNEVKYGRYTHYGRA